VDRLELETCIVDVYYLCKSVSCGMCLEVVTGKILPDILPMCLC
jgi:hypothetical protein